MWAGVYLACTQQGRYQANEKNKSYRGVGRLFLVLRGGERDAHLKGLSYSHHQEPMCEGTGEKIQTYFFVLKRYKEREERLVSRNRRYEPTTVVVNGLNL